jgi:hypothetical protein
MHIRISVVERGYLAREQKTRVWAIGLTAEEAVGRLILRNTDLFSFRIKD